MILHVRAGMESECSVEGDCACWLTNAAPDGRSEDGGGSAAASIGSPAGELGRSATGASVGALTRHGREIHGPDPPSRGCGPLIVVRQCSTVRTMQLN